MFVLSRLRGATAVLAIVISACGGAAVVPSATPAPAPAAIDIQGFKFPANTDVAKGTTVTWTNKDTTKHTVTSGTRPNKDGKFDGQLDAAGTFSFTFTDAGTFSYYCALHSSMNATITVK
jgi:plastocyanin